MEYLMIVLAVLLIAVVVISGDKDERGVTGMSRGLLRVMAVALFACSFALAFGVVEVPTKYYGFVKLQHQLAYATVVGLGAVTLAILSAFSKGK